MLTHLMRTLRHSWLGVDDARRQVPPAAAARLRERVAASEQRHAGQIRICIEGGLPHSYLWRQWRERVPGSELVRQRAVMMFSKLRVWDTEQHSGVLIYLLLAEHAIELVADRGLARAVPTATWNAITEHLSEQLKAGRFEDGLARAVEEISALLVQHFPRDAGAQLPPNELPDEPVFR